MKKIKASQEELKVYLESAKDSLKKELIYRDRYFTKGELYHGELERVEENIKNYKDFIRLLEDNIL